MKLFHALSAKRLVILLFLIYLLNCSDLLFTYTYLKLGGFYEANPLMNHLLNNPFLLIISKLIFPGILISYLISKANEIIHEQYRLYLCGLYMVFIFYILVNLLHLYYLFFYI